MTQATNVSHNVPVAELTEAEIQAGAYIEMDVSMDAETDLAPILHTAITKDGAETAILVGIEAPDTIVSATVPHDEQVLVFDAEIDDQACE